ncbi:MAG: response regulator [Anaerolineae bacterium]|nr:MAG: response regulator [Anaerolineae bacterium]
MPPRQTGAGERENRMNTSPPLVIVGERDPFMQRTLRRVIGDRYQLEFVENGGFLVPRVRQQQPAAVILEILLPGIDGLMVCKLLKEDPTTAHIPVVFYTYFTLADRIREVGGDAHLIKPQHAGRLVETLDRLISGAQAE